MGFFKKIGHKFNFHHLKKLGKKATHTVAVIGRKAGHTLQKVGGVAKTVGTLTGQPELVALGASAETVGGTALGASHALNKARKGKLEKALDETVKTVHKGQKAKRNLMIGK